MPLPAFGRQPMKSGSQKSGFTLIEILAVIAIILILISVMAGVGKRIDDQGKERLCRTTIELVGNALEQFREFGYEYKDANCAGLVFPLDCNDFLVAGIDDTLRYALYPPAPPTVFVNITDSAFVNITDSAYDPNFSGSAAMYFILNQVSDCRTTLEKIDKSLLTNTGTDGKPTYISIEVGGVVTAKYPFMRIIDPWGKPLRYDYYPDRKDNPTGDFQYYIDNVRTPGKRTFPVITSAGPDKTFDTKDDVSNIQQK
jgi:prepilin-type N-terminal cleavage/methylation domain-containing protein